MSRREPKKRPGLGRGAGAGAPTPASWATRTALGLAVVLGATLALQPSVARSQVLHSLRELLTSRFHGSERVRYVDVRPDRGQRAAIERRLGRRLGRERYTFYVATSGGTVEGYALFDAERGQHELIDLATFFDAAGRVTDVVIVAYREPFGDGVRSARFRRQFIGRDARSGFRTGRDVDVVSGSTLSSRAVAAAVQRASVMLDVTLLAGRLAGTVSPR